MSADTPDILTAIDDGNWTGRDIATVAQLAVAATRGVPLDRGQPRAFLVPQADGGYRLEVAEPTHRQQPRRITGTAHMVDHASLADYVTEHDTGAATLYADVDQLVIVAVLNDDHDGAAGWRDHRAFLKLRTTPEWDHWTKADGKSFDQATFAEYLEQHAHDVVSPDAATMVEVARTFQARRDVEFSSAVNAQDGSVQLTYNETIDGRAGRGQMTVPDTFVVRLAPFYGADPVEVTARFRYRLRAGELTLGYALLHTDRIIRMAFDTVVEELEELTGQDVHQGLPAEPRSDDGER